MHEVDTEWLEIEKQVTCLICHQVYTDPHTVSCQHIFCKKCISYAIKEFTAEVFCCPICNQQSAQDQVLPMSTNTFSQRLIDIIQMRNEFKSGFFNRQCDRCVSGNTAIMWCKKCGKAHCSACKIVHETWQEFKSHNKVITAEEFMLSPNEIFLNEASKPCSVHDKQPLNLYCETCGILVCRDCVMKKHQDHNFDNIDEMISKIEGKMQSSVALMEQLLEQVTDRLTRIEDYERQASSVLYINEPSAASIESIDGSIEERQLENVENIRMTLMKRQKRRTEIVETQLTDFVEFCRSIKNTKQFLPFNDWTIKRMDDAVKQINIDLPVYNVEVTRVGYWVRLIATLRNEYGLPATDQSKNLMISCNEVGFIQNLEIEEQSNGVYHIWYIPNRKETHSLSVCWTKNIDDTDKKEITVYATDSVKIVNTYKLPEEFIWLKSTNRNEAPKDPKTKYVPFPYFMATGPNGELIVNDDSTNHLIVFDYDFMPSHTIGRNSFTDMENITGITVNEQGHVFVADKNLDCIHKFKLDGRWISEFGTSGKDAGKFQSPHGLVSLKYEKLFVCDRHNNRIQVFQKEEFIYSFGQHGTEPGNFNEPIDIAVNSNENQIFVTDNCNHRVQVFSPQGQFLKIFGNFSNVSARLRHPFGIYYTPEKFLLVSSYGTNSVLVFKEDESLFLEIKGTSQGSQRFTTPCGVVMTKNRQIVIASHYKNRLIVY